MILITRKGNYTLSRRARRAAIVVRSRAGPERSPYRVSRDIVDLFLEDDRPRKNNPTKRIRDDDDYNPKLPVPRSRYDGPKDRPAARKKRRSDNIPLVQDSSSLCPPNHVDDSSAHQNREDEEMSERGPSSAGPSGLQSRPFRSPSPSDFGGDAYEDADRTVVAPSPNKGKGRETSLFNDDGSASIVMKLMTTVADLTMNLDAAKTTLLERDAAIRELEVGLVDMTVRQVVAIGERDDARVRIVNLETTIGEQDTALQALQAQNARLEVRRQSEAEGATMFFNSWTTARADLAQEKTTSKSLRVRIFRIAARHARETVLRLGLQKCVKRLMNLATESQNDNNMLRIRNGGLERDVTKLENDKKILIDEHDARDARDKAQVDDLKRIMEQAQKTHEHNQAPGNKRRRLDVGTAGSSRHAQ